MLILVRMDSLSIVLGRILRIDAERHICKKNAFGLFTVEPESNVNLGLSIHSSSSSPENSDDFVLVPKNLPTDEGVVNYERK